MTRCALSLDACVHVCRPVGMAVMARPRPGPTLGGLAGWLELRRHHLRRLGRWVAKPPTVPPEAGDREREGPRGVGRSHVGWRF